MNRKLLFVFCFISLSGVIAAGQVRSITNSDIEKYRQERLKAEAELRDNYVKLGFPSPDELERRRAQSRVETDALSSKLRDERLERERIEGEQRSAMERTSYFAPPIGYYPVQTGPQFGYYWQTGRNFRGPVIRSPRGPTGYYAGGQFWPVPQRPRFVPRSVWTPRRR